MVGMSSLSSNLESPGATDDVGRRKARSIVVQQRSTSTLRDFEFHELLGRGSFGKVYRVTRKQDGQIYVMKQINVAEMSEPEQRDAVNEVKVMASMDHCNIVRYFDSFIDGELLNIVMEFCDGGDLQAYLKQLGGKSLPEPQIWHIFIQICQGMAYMHKKRILHRDLKTANLFLASLSSMSVGANSNSNVDAQAASKTKTANKLPKLAVKIGDLGVARVLNSSSSFAQTLVGTPYYLSPELCEDKPYNNRSDVWALGCILYELCSLKHPFVAKNQGALILKIVRGKYPALDADLYSPSLRQLVKCMLSRSPSRRPTVQHILGLNVVRSWATRLGLAGQMPAAASAIPRENSESTHTSTREKSVKPRRAWGKPIDPANHNKRSEKGEAENLHVSMSRKSSVAKARDRAAQENREQVSALKKLQQQRHTVVDMQSRRLPRYRQHARGNIRGTRVRRRGGKRLISSHVGTGPTGTIRFRGTTPDDSVTIQGPDLSEGHVHNSGPKSSTHNLTNNLVAEPSNTLDSITHSRVSAPIKHQRSRPTIAQLHQAMTKTAERSTGQDRAKAKTSHGNKPNHVVSTHSPDRDTVSIDQNEYSLDLTASKFEIGDKDFDAKDFVFDDDATNGGKDIVEDEDVSNDDDYVDDEENSPSLFVQHVDVLWRVMEEGSHTKNQSPKTTPHLFSTHPDMNTESTSSSENLVDSIEYGIIDDASGMIVAESRNNDVANSMSLVAEELVNDMLDREQEIQKAYSDKFKACVEVFGNETVVATMISTLIHEESGNSLDFVRTLLPRQPKTEGVESKMIDGMADDETAANALRLAVKLAALSEEKDQLEENINSVIREVNSS